MYLSFSFRRFFLWIVYLRTVYISISKKSNLNKKDMLGLIKRRSKVYQNNLLRDRALNFLN